MPLLSLAPPAVPYYVLLVVDDRAGTIAARLAGSSLVAHVIPCASYHEAATSLLSGRRYSAVVGRGRDAELEGRAWEAGVPLIPVGWSWPPAAVAAAVEATAVPVPRVDLPPSLFSVPRPPSGRDEDRSEGGRLVAVCGPGGTGTSTVAAALAAHLAVAGRVLLADFARRADQAFLHGVEDPGTGLLALAEAGRYRPIAAADVGRATVQLPVPGLRLLPGLRRPGHWTAVSPRAFDDVLSRLVELFYQVVADITADFEGEADGGSLDVEERNHPARRSVRAADAVIVVGQPGPHGTRRLALVIDDLLDLGVDPARVQPLINGSTCSPAPSRICGLPAAPLVAATGTDWGPLAATIARLLALDPRPDRTPVLVRVAPGSLGFATQ